MRSAHGLFLVLLPRSPKAKAVIVKQNQKMRLKSQRKSRMSEAQQPEVTGTKRFEIMKLTEKRSV